ncbi:MAG: restriction endonuclease subunit S [Verrucomicrobia bacterium]|nr:restriction endonuclease subunit S [Verrucomicrobiota bacterium]
MKTVPLGEVCEFIRGVTFDKADATPKPGSGKTPILRAGNIGEELDTQNDLVWVPDERVSEEQFFRRNDIVICMSSGSSEVVGKTARVVEDIHASVGSFCGIIRPKNPEEAAYLSYFFRSSAFIKCRDRIARGANIQNLRFSQFEEIDLEIPSEQRRIAEQLERADRLRRTRRYALALSATFLPAAFRELFGDRLTTGPFDRFGDLVTITGGGTPARDRPEFYTGRIPWLTSKDMRGDYIFDTEEHITEQAIKQSATKLIPANSILVVVKSKVLMHRLPLAIAKVALCHGQDIKSIQCSEMLHHEFARFVLKDHEPRLLHIARGANTEGLTLPMLEELPVPCVRMKEQERFAELVARHERLRSVQRESLRQADHLFQTLLHQAFTGGL